MMLGNVDCLINKQESMNRCQSVPPASPLRCGWFGVLGRVAMVAGCNGLLFLLLAGLNRPVEMPRLVPDKTKSIIYCSRPPSVLPALNPSCASSPEKMLREPAVRQVPVQIDSASVLLVEQTDVRCGLSDYVFDQTDISGFESAAATLTDGRKPSLEPFQSETVDQSPRCVTGSPPRYPRWACRQDLQAQVHLKFVVETDGTVQRMMVEQTEGDQRFASVAAEAVRQWRFTPAIKNDRAVPCWCRQTIWFTINRDGR